MQNDPVKKTSERVAFVFLFPDHVTIHRHFTLLFNILIQPGTLNSFSFYTKIIFFFHLESR